MVSEILRTIRTSWAWACLWVCLGVRDFKFQTFLQNLMSTISQNFRANRPVVTENSPRQNLGGKKKKWKKKKKKK